MNFMSDGAAAAGDDVEEELQELVSEMVKLKVGLKKACVAFARSLADEGVMSLEELRAHPSSDARGFLEKSGMKKVQIDKVLAAYSNAPAASSPAAAPAPAPAAAAPAGDDEQEELQELVSEMVKLKVGLKKACVAFARSLADEGVMSLEELRSYPSAKARGFLEKSGMQEVQVDKVMAAHGSLPAASAPAPAPAPSFEEAKASSSPFINSAPQLLLRFPDSLLF
jgi:hypothetical protein